MSTNESQKDNLDKQVNVFAEVTNDSIGAIASFVTKSVIHLPFLCTDDIKRAITDRNNPYKALGNDRLDIPLHSDYKPSRLFQE